MRRLLALAMLLLAAACDDCSGVSCPLGGLDVSANVVRGGMLEVCVEQRCDTLTMSADPQPVVDRSEFHFFLDRLGVWPESFGPPATAAVAPTIFADKQGFAVRITLKGADGAIIMSKETRAKRESGECCGPHWSARI